MEQMSHITTEERERERDRKRKAEGGVVGWSIYEEMVLILLILYVDDVDCVDHDCRFYYF